MSRRLATARLLTVLAVLAWAPAAMAQQRPERDPRPDVQEQARPAAAKADSTADRSAAAPATVARDSILNALLELDGYAATEYQGRAVRFDADSARVVLSGRAEVVRAGQTMTADSLLVLDQKTSIACGYGQPKLSGDQTRPVESDRMCFDVDKRLGIAESARTQYNHGANWFVHGEKVYTVGSDRMYSAHARFTSCDLTVPHYHFAAGEIKIINDEILVARDITLNFGDVPVFWLPFLIQSLKKGRRSGILTPRVGMNDIARNSASHQRHIQNVGFYWAINDYADAQVALDWYSGNWTALNGRLQYRWTRQFLNGGISWRQFWRDEGGREFTVSSNNSWRPTERTNVRASANYASSSQFVEENSFDPDQLNRTMDSRASVSHRFDWGSVNAGASRRQHLSTNKVDLSLPSLSLSISPITLIDHERFDLTWNSTSLGYNQDRTIIDPSEFVPGERNRSSTSASFSSGFNLSDLGLSGSIDFSDIVRSAKPALIDTVVEVVGDTMIDTVYAALPYEAQQSIGWTTSIRYSQHLIGQTRLSPGISIRGRSLQDARTGGTMISEPVETNFNVGLSTAIYGFWPGVGPFSRIRHGLTPSMSYGYSPARTATAMQDSIFRLGEPRPSNTISFQMSQTIEAKYKEKGVAADTAGTGTQAGPRRASQGRKAMLLSLNTSGLTYDFVRARDGEPGLVTTSIRNSIRSDLLPGLSLTTSHELFDTRGEDAPRVFAPHLSTVRMGFSVGSSSPIIRALGLAGGAVAGAVQGEDPAALDDPYADPTVPDGGVLPDQGPGVGGARGRTAAGGGAVGSWNASIDYSLVRPRPEQAAVGGQGENQMVHANIRFRPTEHWNVSWNTAYSVTEGEFSNHSLNLTRDLHRWQANFSFVKAQNGNFAFQFFVSLRDNPDIKVDYEQRGRGADTGALNR